MNTKFATSKFPFWREPKGIACILIVNIWFLAGAEGLGDSQLKCRCCVGAVEMFGMFSPPEKALSSEGFGQRARKGDLFCEIRSGSGVGSC